MAGLFTFIRLVYRGDNQDSVHYTEYHNNWNIGSSYQGWNL